MIDAILMFRRNRARIIDLGSIYGFWCDKTPILQAQLDEILRAQLVLIVSAFDTFIHDCVRIGIVKQFGMSGAIAHKLNNYRVSFEDMRNMCALSSSADRMFYLDGVIRKANSHDSFQSPTNVEYAMGLLGVGHLWLALSKGMGMPAADIRAELSNIVNRRNKIAHESDLDPTGVSLNPITKKEVDEVIRFMYGLAINVYLLLK